MVFQIFYPLFCSKLQYVTIFKFHLCVIYFHKYTDFYLRMYILKIFFHIFSVRRRTLHVNQSYRDTMNIRTLLECFKCIKFMIFFSVSKKSHKILTVFRLFQRQSLHALNSKRKPKLAMNCVAVVFEHIIVRHDGVHH